MSKFILYSLILFMWGLMSLVGAQENPTAEETQTYIANHFDRCGTLNDSQRVISSSGRATQVLESESIGAAFKGPEAMTLIKRDTEQWYAEGEGSAGAEWHYEWEYYIPLAELTPEVATEESEIRLSCSNSKCIGVSVTKADCHMRGRPTDCREVGTQDSISQLDIKTCEPDRAANALTHLIELNGGEESPF